MNGGHSELLHVAYPSQNPSVVASTPSRPLIVPDGRSIRNVIRWLFYLCLPRPESLNPTSAEYSSGGNIVDEHLEIILLSGLNIPPDVQWLMWIWDSLADSLVGVDIPPSMHRPI